MIKDLLAASDHRPWPVPLRRWAYYQEWREVVFLHYRLAVADLVPHLPKGLMPDVFDGDAWVSLVAFDMMNVQPRWAMPIPFVSDFHEVNIRTYVRHGSMAGVYFLRIEAANRIAVALARTLSVLPYRHARINRVGSGNVRSIALSGGRAPWSMRYSIGKPIVHPDQLDNWLTERYCLYHDVGELLYRYHVHHAPWPLRYLEVSEAPLVGGLKGINFDNVAAAHYSPGVEVLSWSIETVN